MPFDIGLVQKSQASINEVINNLKNKVNQQNATQQAQPNTNNQPTINLGENQLFSPTGKPIDNVITQGFGKAGPSVAHFYPGGIHNGLDIDITQGDDIYAVTNAKVTRVNPSAQGYGGTIELTDANGYTYMYGHLSDTSGVKEGDTVSAGQRIASGGGDKGTQGAGTSTGSHLHFSVSKKGAGTIFGKYNEVEDPMAFLKNIKTK